MSTVAASTLPLQPHPLQRLARLVPGLLACAAVTGLALATARIEAAVFGHAWLEPLVLAILLGAVTRLVWRPTIRWRRGIDFGAKFVLELAIVLLGASVSAATLSSLGGLAILGIVLLVVIAIAGGFGAGLLLGLKPRLALLTACGNAICGNSAIASVAPVIEAEGEEVAASIAFTAVLGVAVVLLLPLLGAALGLDPVAYGFLAGLSVYAVPQVLAATASFGTVASQIGAVVKLVRVLMLGPVVLALTLIMGRRAGAKAPGISRLAPWFILGFLAMMGLRLTSAIPQDLLPVFAGLSSALTIMAMAGLGLQTDILAVARSGGRVLIAAVLSLGGLIGLSLLLIHWVL